MNVFLIAYLVIMFVWCCVGFVVVYVVDEGLDLGWYIGVMTGLIWPLSLVGFVLIGIGKLILFIRDRE